MWSGQSHAGATVPSDMHPSLLFNTDRVARISRTLCHAVTFNRCQCKLVNSRPTLHSTVQDKDIVTIRARSQTERKRQDA